MQTSSGGLMAPGEMLTDFTAADLTSTAQSEMFAFWEHNCADAQLPPKSVLDPVDFPRVSLPMIGVMQPVEEDDFRIRVVGTGVRNAVGIEFTGLLVSQIPGAGAALERFRWCRDNARPYFTSGPVGWGGQKYRFYSVLALPFGTAEQVDRIMLVFDFMHREP